MIHVARLLIPLVIVVGLTLGTGPSPALAEDPSPGPTAVATPAAGGPGPIGISLPDPRQWAVEVFNQVLVNLLNGVASAVRGIVSSVLGSSLNFITQTPPAGSYTSPTVVALWGIVRGIADAALLLVALSGGFNLMVREHLNQAYHGAMELFPRLALGALLANTSLSWGQLAINANNALCSVVGTTSLPAWQQADPTTQVLVDLLGALIYLVTSLLLLLQMLMRLALVDVLLVISPLGLLCWVLPQTQGWARLWSSLFFGTVFTQFVQVVVLRLGNALLTEVTPMAPDAALLAVFLGIAVLALTLKVPGLMRNHIGDGLGFVRYYVYRQGARSLEGSGAGTRGGP